MLPTKKEKIKRSPQAGNNFMLDPSYSLCVPHPSVRRFIGLMEQARG
jgi:hypothetical protein